MYRDDILAWIDQKRSKTYTAKQLNCKIITLNGYLKTMGIEYAGQMIRSGEACGYISAYTYLEDNNKYISSHHLKIKLIKENIKKDECEVCGISEWQGKKLSLDLHHKDGNHYNNKLDNLQILCPNCHRLENEKWKKIKKRKNKDKKGKCKICNKYIS